MTIDNSGNIHAGDGKFAGHIRDTDDTDLGAAPAQKIPDAAASAIASLRTLIDELDGVDNDFPNFLEHLSVRLAHIRSAAEVAEFDVTQAQVVSLVKSRFPNATELEFEDITDEGGPFWEPTHIRDADDNVLWQRRDWEDDTEDEELAEFEETLNGLVPGLDRMGEDYVRLHERSSKNNYAHYGIQF